VSPARARILLGGSAVAAVAGVVVGTPYLAADPGLFFWAALFGVPVVLAAWVRSHFLDGAVPPLILIPCGFVLLGVLGSIMARSVGAEGGVSAVLVLNDLDTWRTALLLVVSATALLVGGAVALALGRRPGRDHLSTPDPALSTGSALASPGRRSVILAVATLPLVATVALDGTALLDRNEYLIGDDGSLAGATATVGMAGVVACGLLLAAERGGRRVLPALVALAYFAMFFALGSRQMALCPLLLAVGYHVAGPSRSSRIGLGAGLLTAVYLLPFPLFLRSVGANGLFPYLQALPDAPAPLDVLTGSADNLLISFPLTGTTAFKVPQIPFSELLVELDPRPGSSTGWYDIVTSLRINPDTPYSALGTLGNHGWTVVVVFWLITGAFLGYLHLRAQTLTALGSRGVALVLVALPLVFTLFSLQYNLRSSVRFLVYAAAIDIVWRLVLALRAALRAPSSAEIPRAVPGPATRTVSTPTPVAAR
jgi:hypothetical protein